jgi:hypothetical protein
MSEPRDAPQQQSDEDKVEDLDVTEEDARNVVGGAYQAYLNTQGTKQGANKGTSP